MARSAASCDWARFLARSDHLGACITSLPPRKHSEGGRRRLCPADHRHQLLMPPGKGRWCRRRRGHRRRARPGANLSRKSTRHENPSRVRIHRRRSAVSTRFAWPQAATTRPMADHRARRDDVCGPPGHGPGRTRVVRRGRACRYRATAGPVAGHLARHRTGRVDSLRCRLNPSYDSAVATPGRAPLPAVLGAARCLAMPRPAYLMAPLTRKR